MAKAASTSKLAELHEMLAEVFLADLRQSVAEGIPLPAANLGVIRQFLKDNEISASIDADNMAAIRDEFAGETGKEISPAYEVLVKPAGRTLIRESGNIYSFRNDQLAFAMLAGVAATQSALEVRISELEKLNA